VKQATLLGRGVYAKLFSLVSISLFLFGCFSSGTSSVPSITIAGSTSVQPFAEKLAEIYMDFNLKQVVINVQGGGSTAGIKACQEKAAQIGTSSRELRTDEEGLKRIIVAWVGIAIIVHPTNPVRNITPDQLRGIFSGKIKSWDRLGWVSKPIYFVTREEGSGTRDAFEHLVMKKTLISDEALVQDSNGSVREIVATNPQAMGYISYGVVNKQVKALAVDRVQPSLQSIKNNTYTLIRPFLFVTLQQPPSAAQKFIDFVLSKEGQGILEREGLVGVH